MHVQSHPLCELDLNLHCAIAGLVVVLQAGLFYHSSNASFPDVELEVDVGCHRNDGEQVCEICRAGDRDSVLKSTDLSETPTIHFGPDHIDVLYAVLMEVKAPYDEYDRLAALTLQQASRPEGFVMILSYAKQWLLSDCLDGVVGNTVTVDDDDDDDDDEFEDAITPPSLLIRADLQHGLRVNFKERQNLDSLSERPSVWTWILGASWGSIKQSCIEDEIRVEIRSVRMYENMVNDLKGYSLIEDLENEASSNDGTKLTLPPLLNFSCIIPAYQSRLVGHQPVLNLLVGRPVIVSVKDETIVRWMTLLSPVYTWWNEWNATHPSMIASLPDDSRIAPISQITVALDRLCILFAVHDEFCFGATVDKLHVSTSEPTHDAVQSLFRLDSVALFSSSANFQLLQEAIAQGKSFEQHEIVVIENGALSKSSHSRTRWSQDAYACKHTHSEDRVQHLGKQHGYADDVLEDEVAMYTYKLNMPNIRSEMTMQEIEAISWVVGKWSFFLPDPPAADLKTQLLKERQSVKRAMCHRKWRVVCPRVQVVLCDEPVNGNCRNRFVLNVEGCDWQGSVCSLNSYQSVSAASIKLSEGDRLILQLLGNQRLETPCLSVEYQVAAVADRLGYGMQSEAVSVLQATEVSIHCEKIVGRLFLPDIETVLGWAGKWSDSFHLGFMLSTCFDYTADMFERNMARLASNLTSYELVDEACSIKASVRIAQGLELTIVHPDQTRRSPDNLATGRPTDVGRLEVSSVLLEAQHGGKVDSGHFLVKGSLRNLSVTDLTSPDKMPSSESTMPNRQCVGAPQGMLRMDSEIAVFEGSKNVVDFVVDYHRASGGGRDACVVRVRLESVCIAYLHRVYKQFHHFVADHILEIALKYCSSLSPSNETVLLLFEKYAVDASRLPVSTDQALKCYLDTRSAANFPADIGDFIQFEVVADDLTLALPRNSFSEDSIVLHCTNARFWSSGVDSSNSEFLQSGLFADEGRTSNGGTLADASIARAQQSRRVELRNMRRQIKNQRARMLSNRSQLFIDLKNATQQAQNYLHEGFESFPAAEDAVKIIHGKIVQVDQQLEDLGQYLAKVDAAIEVAKAQGDAFNHGGRDSLTFLSSTPTSARSTLRRGRSESIERIRDAVAGMSQHLMAPIFVADDAEFHDARTATDVTMLSSIQQEDEDMSTSSLGLFEFELVDLSGMTSNSSSPLFHHSLLTGRIDSEPESLSETVLSSYFNITLSLNELSIDANADQYLTLLGMIYENFKEFSFIVDEDTYPHCSSCDGHHFDYEHCNSIWLQVPVRVGDAALRISTADHPIVELFAEQLELMFTMRTDDSLVFGTTALSFTAIDVRPTNCPTGSEIIRPITGDGLQIQYSQRSTWTEVAYDLKVSNTNCLVIYPAFEEAVNFFIGPILSGDMFIDFGVGFMPPPFPEWNRVDFRVCTSGCLFSLLEDFSKSDSRGLVLLTDVSAAFSQSLGTEEALEMKKWHIEIEQNGIYFSQLPDLQVRCVLLRCSHTLQY